METWFGLRTTVVHHSLRCRETRLGNSPQGVCYLPRGCVILRGGAFGLTKGCVFLRGGCVILQGGVLSSEGVCYLPRGCVLSCEGVCFLARGCVIFQGCVFCLPRVRVIFRGCVLSCEGGCYLAYYWYTATAVPSSNGGTKDASFGKVRMIAAGSAKTTGSANKCRPPQTSWQRKYIGGRKYVSSTNMLALLRCRQRTSVHRQRK